MIIHKSARLKLRSIYEKCFKRKEQNDRNQPLIWQNNGSRDFGRHNDHEIHSIGSDFMDASSTFPQPLLSGSGGGCPALAQQTIAIQIKILEEKGRGRYGSVHRARWQGKDVAVKKFQSWDDDSWQHEVEMYETQLICHENLLRYIAADSIDNGTATERWLITDFYERGSLFDFLSANIINKDEAFNLLRSCVSGLEHLHKPINSNLNNKQPIVHRDIKSRNILVSNEGHAVIGDLGLALRLDQFLGIKSNHMTNRLKEGNRKIGTTRFMAPEVLTGTIDKSHFESFKQADIYSLSLVMWEIMSRTSIGTMIPGPYKLPYAYLGPDPSIEIMKNKVARQELRPQFSPFIESDGDFSKVSKMVKECWATAPNKRLTALRLKKSLDELPA